MKSIKVLVIPVPVDEPVYEMELLDDEQTPHHLLMQMQGLVSGYIEALSDRNDQAIMWVNEDGIAKGLPHNYRATVITETWYPFGSTWILGQAVITGPRTDDGYETGLPDETIRAIKGLIDDRR